MRAGPALCACRIFIGIMEKKIEATKSACFGSVVFWVSREKMSDTWGTMFFFLATITSELLPIFVSHRKT